MSTNPRYLRSNMSEERLQQARRAEKRRIADRELGKPRMVFDWEFRAFIQKIEAMRDAGMTQVAMAEGTGGKVSDRQFSNFLRGKQKSCYRTTFEAVMAAEIVGNVSEFGARMPVLGSARRVRALRANGWPIKSPVLVEILGVPSDTLRMISNDHRISVFHTTHDRIKIGYDKLMDANPADYGVPGPAILKAKKQAVKSGMIPSMCWDEDTIEDPDAFPEWTGACGTVHGYNLHRKLGIAMLPNDSGGQSVGCAACCRARRDAKHMRDQEVADKRDALIDHLAAGTPYPKIAAELGMSVRTVQRAARDLKGSIDNEEGR